MITFQELRYGNKLLFLDKVVTFKNITNIREDSVFWINVLEDFIPQKSFHFKPIPLTEEWLLEFGFVKGKFGFFETKKRLLVEDLGNSITYDNKLLNTKIKHVHQLQNFYFALTEEELTIKE
jgi:hypothetical protein